MQHLLITNDDGHKSAGIRALIDVFSDNYKIIAIAPKYEQSWVSKSITRHKELSVEEAEYCEFKGYTVDGTPADCVQVGMYHILDDLPDFVISGINVGSNVGYEEILSSGTIGAALEAALQGVPAFASSLKCTKEMYATIDFNTEEAISYFRDVAAITKNIIERILEAGFPSDTHLISINVPWGANLSSKQVVTKPHTSRHEELFEVTEGKYKHRGAVGLKDPASDDSDLSALSNGYVSILPINIQLTTRKEQESLAKILNISILGD